MKLLLLVLALLLSNYAQAQRRIRTPEAQTLFVPIEYCVLIVRNPGVNQELILDYGQGTPTNVQDSTMVRLFLRTHTMTSSAAALNYLFSQGWEPQQASAFAYRATSTNEVLSQQHYVLRRRRL